MNAFISTDCDTILERLQGEKLLNIVPDELGNVLLVFESSNPDVSDLLTVKPDGKIIATLLYDEDDPASPCWSCWTTRKPCAASCCMHPACTADRSAGSRRRARSEGKDNLHPGRGKRRTSHAGHSAGDVSGGKGT